VALKVLLENQYYEVLHISQGKTCGFYAPIELPTSVKCLVKIKVLYLLYSTVYTITVHDTVWAA